MNAAPQANSSLAPANTSVPTGGAQIPGLEQLRDIHLPAPVSWWPPAPGWWLLAIIIVIGTVALALWLTRRSHQRRYRKSALQQLRSLYQSWQQQRDDIAFAQATNRLLKQTALAAFPAADVAALSGADWLDFLDRKLRRPRFTEPDVRALATLYLREPQTIAAEPLHAAAQHWIRSHRC
ncbi:MAG TPA: DUF4381 domain-containing protein [Spongiibacteraceae bacterium]|jgi:hypothetical protein